MKAEELRKKLRAVDILFKSEEEKKEFVRKTILPEIGSSLEYESGKELAELSQSLKDFPCRVHRDYEIYTMLTQRPQGAFTSGDLERLYAKEMEVNPMLRIRALEERVSMLEKGGVRSSDEVSFHSDEVEELRRMIYRLEERISVLEGRIKELLEKGDFLRAEREEVAGGGYEYGEEEEGYVNIHQKESYWRHDERSEPEEKEGYYYGREEEGESIIQPWSGEEVQGQGHQVLNEVEYGMPYAEDFFKREDGEEKLVKEALEKAEEPEKKKEEEDTFPLLTLISLLNAAGYLITRFV